MTDETAVREAFARSLRVVWLTMVGMGGVGLLSVTLMREVPMQKHTDDKYGLDDGHQLRDEVGIAEVNASLPADSLPEEK